MQKLEDRDMLFYKVDGMVLNSESENEDSRRAQREATRTRESIAIKTSCSQK